MNKKYRSRQGSKIQHIFAASLCRWRVLIGQLLEQAKEVADSPGLIPDLFLRHEASILFVQLLHMVLQGIDARHKVSGILLEHDLGLTNAWS